MCSYRSGSSEWSRGHRNATGSTWKYRFSFCNSSHLEEIHNCFSLTCTDSLFKNVVLGPLWHPGLVLCFWIQAFHSFWNPASVFLKHLSKARLIHVCLFSLQHYKERGEGGDYIQDTKQSYVHKNAEKIFKNVKLLLDLVLNTTSAVGSVMN